MTVFGYQPRAMSGAETYAATFYLADIFDAGGKWIEQRRFDSKSDAISYARQLGATFTC